LFLNDSFLVVLPKNINAKPINIKGLKIKNPYHKRVPIVHAILPSEFSYAAAHNPAFAS
jgi:hypothetical protein